MNKKYYFLHQKMYSTCSIKCFSERCTCTVFWPSEIPWCAANCLTEGWWRGYSEKWNRYTVQQTSSEAPSISYNCCSPLLRKTTTHLGQLRKSTGEFGRSAPLSQ